MDNQNIGFPSGHRTSFPNDRSGLSNKNRQAEKLKARITAVLVSAIAAMLASCSHKTMDFTGTEGKAVDLGLSVMWADHNLGASSEDGRGTWFQWGDSIRPDKRKFRDKAAAWGKRWRTPTIDEMQELMDSCQWTWRSANPSGYIVTGRNGNSVFFPNTSKGYWTSETKPKDRNFAMYMYFNAAYPDLSYTEPHNERLLRPVTTLRKHEIAAPHSALAEIRQSEREKQSDAAAKSEKILTLTENRILPLNADSTARQPFTYVTSSRQTDGYHIISDSTDHLTVRVKGVAAFSFKVKQIGTKKTFVRISVNSGERSEDIDEEIEIADAPYDIPAVIISPTLPTVITIRSLRGQFAIQSLHMLHTYTNREMEPLE